MGGRIGTCDVGHPPPSLGSGRKRFPVNGVPLTRPRKPAPDSRRLTESASLGNGGWRPAPASRSPVRFSRSPVRFSRAQVRVSRSQVRVCRSLSESVGPLSESVGPNPFIPSSCRICFPILSVSCLSPSAPVDCHGPGALARARAPARARHREIGIRLPRSLPSESAEPRPRSSSTPPAAISPPGRRLRVPSHSPSPIAMVSSSGISLTAEPRGMPGRRGPSVPGPKRIRPFSAGAAVQSAAAATVTGTGKLRARTRAFFFALGALTTRRLSMLLITHSSWLGADFLLSGTDFSLSHGSH